MFPKFYLFYFYTLTTEKPSGLSEEEKETVTVHSYFLHPSWKLSLNTDPSESPHTSEEAFLDAYSSNQVWFCYFKDFWIFQLPGSLNFDMGRRQVTLSRNLCKIQSSEDLLKSSRNWIGVFVSQDAQFLHIQALSLRVTENSVGFRPGCPVLKPPC